MKKLIDLSILVCPQCGSEDLEELFDDSEHCECEYAGTKCHSCGKVFDDRF